MPGWLAAERLADAGGGAAGGCGRRSGWQMRAAERLAKGQADNRRREAHVQLTWCKRHNGLGTR